MPSPHCARLAGLTKLASSSGPTPSCRSRPCKARAPGWKAATKGGERLGMDDMGVYTVQDGKVTEERFFTAAEAAARSGHAQLAPAEEQHPAGGCQRQRHK